MPLLNYCKKCNVEVPAEATCPHCGKKLTKGGLRLGFGAVVTPVSDAMCWLKSLRLLLPAMVLLTALILILTAALGGSYEAERLLSDGFLLLMLLLSGIAVLVLWLLLEFRGPQNEYYELNDKYAAVSVYLPDGEDRPFKLRFTSKNLSAYLESREQVPHIPGYCMIRRQTIAWSNVKAVRINEKKQRITLSNPAWWTAVVIRCPDDDMEPTVEWIEKQMKKNKEVREVPIRKG